jgi:hypothetical protein
LTSPADRDHAHFADFAILVPAGRTSVFTTIAILMVGCFVVYAVVLALAFFTDGGRAGSVMPAKAQEELKYPRRGIRSEHLA